MRLLALPNELLLQIARCLLHSPTNQFNCDCDCHQISPDLSAFSRVNQHLHALLAEYVLATASTMRMLFWAVANSRTDTVALALERGADPNSWLRTEFHVDSSWLTWGSAVDLAITLRVCSPDAGSHARKLAVLTLLFAAGGVCKVDTLIKPTRYGDLDLLALCLPHMTDHDDMYRHWGPRDLLETASSCGHVEAVKLALHAGATVNSTGDHNEPGFHPALWVCWEAPIAVLQLLLDAGADATWRDHHGVSVVQNIREMSVGRPKLEKKIALLVRYGAVDEGACWRTVRSGAQFQRRPEKEYRGWVPSVREPPFDWSEEWLVEKKDGCGCSSRADIETWPDE